MGILDALNLLEGLCLFLFGMTLMGQALERRAGGGLKTLLARLTSNKFAGLMTGLAVTAIVQSSSATTVMVVGFVNSGLMTLRQAINVIMGANVGTTVTAWILSLAGIDSDNIFINLLKPSFFTPILALVGLVFFMGGKNAKRKDGGLILLGFSTLMFGMESMSGAVSCLRDVPEFQRLFVAFTNPLLGVLAGAILTAIIQSSSASVGILQALASTGAVSYGAAVPIVMGQNIGTCVTAMLSSVGANKNARRAAFVHLSFNVIGAAVWLTVFCLVKELAAPTILSRPAGLVGIAAFHSIFNILCTLLMVPFSGALEKLACMIVHDAKTPEKTPELDERLLVSPALALERCRQTLNLLALSAMEAFRGSVDCVLKYDAQTAEKVRKLESETDRLEDVVGSYVVKLTARRLGEEESVKATEYMKLIVDYERIADHAVNILESAEKLSQKETPFSEEAIAEFNVLCSAVTEALALSYQAFSRNDYASARKTEPLEQVVDDLKEELRTRHIQRLQKGECSIDVGFIWSDLLTDFERVSDHCSNVSGYVLDTARHNMNIHENQRAFRKTDEDFKQLYVLYQSKYGLPD